MSEGNAERHAILNAEPSISLRAISNLIDANQHDAFRVQRLIRLFDYARLCQRISYPEELLTKQAIKMAVG